MNPSCPVCFNETVSIDDGVFQCQQNKCGVSLFIAVLDDNYLLTRDIGEFRITWDCNAGFIEAFDCWGYSQKPNYSFDLPSNLPFTVSESQIRLLITFS